MTQTNSWRIKEVKLLFLQYHIHEENFLTGIKDMLNGRLLPETKPDLEKSNEKMIIFVYDVA